MSRPEIEAEYADLAADVRATAPRMSPELAQRLEEIFAAPPRPRWRERMWRPGVAIALAGGIATVLAIAIVRPGDETSHDSGAPSSAARPAIAQKAPPQAAQSERTPDRRARKLPPTPSVFGGEVAPSRPRHVERDLSLTLAAKPADYDDVADGVVHTTDRFGGYVQRSSVDEEGRAGRATFDLRIPSSRLDAAVAALSRLAHVRAREAGSEDVTGAYNAAAGRLADARAERRALLRALGRATTAAQVESLRARLREVRERIGRERRAFDALRKRTNLARVSVTVETARGASAGHAGDDGSWSPGDAARDAVKVLEVALGVTLVGLAAILPLALLAGLAAAALRTARRRRREAALSA